MKMKSFAVIISVLIFSIYTCYSQLVASYPFTSGQALDVSGNKLHGEVINGIPTCDRFGKLNSAIFFDGSAYVSVPHSNRLSFGNRGFTLCAWIKFCRNLGDYAGIIAKGPEKIFYPGYQLTITEQGKITTQIGDSTGYGIERRGNSMLNDGQWHFVVLAVGSSGSTVVVNLYVDGKLESYTEKYTPNAGLDASLHYTEPLFIGKERNSEVYFRGTIDDVELYNQSLTEQQVAAIYNRNNWPRQDTASFIEGSDTLVICNNQPVSLVARKACYENYQWSTGERKQIISVNKAGNYIAQATDINGCIVKDTVVIVECEAAAELIAYYPFNNNAYDSTINRFDGITKGVISTCDRFGKANSAYAFNGISSIEVPHHSKLSFGISSFGICAWVKFCQPLADYAGIVCKGPIDVFYPGYQLTIAGKNKLTTQIGDSSGYGIEQRGNYDLDDGQWHFVVLVVTPASKSRQYIRMYIDGNMEKTIEIYSPISGLDASLDNMTPLYIGKDRNSKVFFKGIIDDIRIYKGVISDSLIKSLYHENNWDGSSQSLDLNIQGTDELCPGDSAILSSKGCYSTWAWSTGDTTSSIIIRKPGIYTLTATDYAGCQAKKSITVKNKTETLLKTNLSKAYKVYPGVSKELVLTLESNIDNINLNYFEFELQYNQGVVQFEKISLENSLLNKWQIFTVNQGNGKYRAIFQAPKDSALKGQGALAYITFKTHIGDTIASYFPYKIIPLINTCNLQAQADPGFISIDSSLCGIKSRLVEIFEQRNQLVNVFFDKKKKSINIKIDNPINQQVSMQLYDISGYLAYKISNEFLLEGKHEYTMELPYLSSGVYFLILNTQYRSYSTLIIN